VCKALHIGTHHAVLPILRCHHAWSKTNDNGRLDGQRHLLSKVTKMTYRSDRIVFGGKNEVLRLELGIPVSALQPCRPRAMLCFLSSRCASWGLSSSRSWAEERTQRVRLCHTLLRAIYGTANPRCAVWRAVRESSHTTVALKIIASDPDAPVLVTILPRSPFLIRVHEVCIAVVVLCDVSPKPVRATDRAGSLQPAGGAQAHRDCHRVCLGHAPGLAVARDRPGSSHTHTHSLSVLCPWLFFAHIHLHQAKRGVDLTANDLFCWPQRAWLAFGTAAAFKMLKAGGSGFGIMHRDVKPDNILLAAEVCLCLCLCPFWLCLVRLRDAILYCT
jgi:hypothetical protein